jgi:CRISPR-associated protein Csx17
MNYLKALGVLRLVCEQKDPGASARWHNGVFELRSMFDEDDVLRYFVEDYRPTPVFAPWNGDGGFLTETGASLETIERIRDDSNPRMQPLRDAVHKIDTVAILREFKTAREAEKMLRKRKDNCRRCRIPFDEGDAEALKNATQRVKSIKQTILANVRDAFPDEIVRWLDACISITSEGFYSAPLLGSGGLDGRLEFSANYLANAITFADLAPMERHQWVEGAIFGRGTGKLIPSSIGQFSPGQIGGPNGTQGFEGSSLVNPLNFVLMIEGAILFAGSVSRKLGGGNSGKAAFPFTVYSTPVGPSMEAPKDSKSARGEIWLPVWAKFAGLNEVAMVLSEGRAEIGGRQATSGVQIARAIASLGVDRGIDGFVRFGFLQRNGKAYLATSLGRFEVRSRPAVDLLREIDPWLDRFSAAASDDNAPPRFRSALRRIQSAIFEFCQHGGNARFAEILRALGRAEHELASGEKFRGNTILPIAGLSSDWIRAAFDDSSEFELAFALSGIWNPEGKVGSLRANLEPVRSGVDKNRKVFANWDDQNRAAVWTSADLPTNLAAVLGRRIMDAGRMGCASLPLAFRRGASLHAVAAFLSGATDDAAIEELLWGLALVGQSKNNSRLDHWRADDLMPLPRAFALLKLLFLPSPLETRSGLTMIRPEPSLLPLLCAGRVGEACVLAMRRLRASGFVPMTGPSEGRLASSEEWQSGVLDPRRLTAALLFPISSNDVKQLANLVLRPVAEPGEIAV